MSSDRPETGSDKSTDGGRPVYDAEEDLEARLALLSTEQVGPTRARWLLGSGNAVAAVEQLRRGRLLDGVGPAPQGVSRQSIDGWGKQLREMNVADKLERHHSLGIEIMAPSDGRWPFSEDPDPPILLFFKGDFGLLQLSPAVAVVGTRRCTTVGRTVAYQLGQDLAGAGVPVVSGLALGVDGSAHRGLLDSGGTAIGVVGSGLDVVYPGANRGLWNEVAETGLLVSEAPAGAKPARWRFPARNRLIAGLSDGVVVVESHGRGGALLTADEAVDRGKPVFVVPGSVLSPASDGTNQLLFDGAVPVRDARDVLGYLGRDVGSGHGAVPDAESSQPGPETQRPVGSPESTPQPTLFVSSSSVRDEPEQGRSELEELILVEAATGPVHLDVLVHAAGSTPHDVLVAVQTLVAVGRLQLDGSTVSLIK